MAQYRKRPVVIEAFRLVIGCAMPGWFTAALNNEPAMPAGPCDCPVTDHIRG